MTGDFHYRKITEKRRGKDYGREGELKKLTENRSQRFCSFHMRNVVREKGDLRRRKDEGDPERRFFIFILRF